MSKITYLNQYKSKQQQLKPAPQLKPEHQEITMSIAKKKKDHTIEIIGSIPNASIVSAFLEQFGYLNYKDVKRFNIDVDHLKQVHQSLSTSIKAAQYVPKEAHSKQSIRSINRAIEIHTALQFILYHPVFEGESLICMYH